MRDERLNVLVLMSDEQRWDTLGCNDNPAARTPHLDRLAERSTVFDGCYTPFPLCCPSRTSMWTGLMPRQHHVLGNWRAVRPDLREGGLGRAFREAGYHTIYNGKWHVPGSTPQRMGFAECSAIPAVLHGQDRGRYIQPYRDHVAGRGYQLVDGNIENLTPADVASLHDPGTPHRATAEIRLQDFLEIWQTERFLRSYDSRPADTPWFAVCSYNAPHFPMVVPRPYDRLIDRERVRLPVSFSTGPETKPREVAESMYATKYADLDESGWVELVAHYLGLCALVDTQVGRILDHLRKNGDLERTIVVFTSDHGDMMGAHRLMEKGHLLHYEEALRIPLLISHPHVRDATRNENLVSVVDFAPSLAELAGVPWRTETVGMSFAGMVGRSSASPTRDHVTAETVLYQMRSEAHGEYVDPSTWNAERDAINLSVRTGRYRYIYRSRDIDELYDHTVDPAEQRNRAAEPLLAGVRTELRSLLADEIGDVFGQVGAELRTT